MRFTTKLIAASALFICATGSFAAGNHAGGHDGHGGNPVGQPGIASKAIRTVTVDMNDSMRYTPAQISVRKGETVRLVVKNSGKLVHELVLGTPEELAAHNAMMQKNPEMEHDDPQMLTLQPGKTGEIIWQFTQAGTVDFACLQPGHFAAGMRGAVVVSSTR